MGRAFGWLLSQFKVAVVGKVDSCGRLLATWLEMGRAFGWLLSEFKVAVVGKVDSCGATSATGAMDAFMVPAVRVRL